jgi:LydA holin phage, holin superfamily III
LSQGPQDVPLLDYLVNVGIALVGAVVRFLREWQKHFGEWNVMRIAIEAMLSVVTAGFCGLLTFWLFYSWKMDPFYTAFGVGVMGHMGPEGIALLQDSLTNGIRSKTPKD